MISTISGFFTVLPLDKVDSHIFVFAKVTNAHLSYGEPPERIISFSPTFVLNVLN